ncbi:hypothetical protein Taro_056686 [Colocasia esculenta]|uniref:Anaphase-promoting complex subunit 13 n=1 Tax=Colocasia esculenta TaxID=4460 RepID=A0A843XUM8_COLES|nr:hypothetical protein [Colocasia esculenta]
MSTGAGAGAATAAELLSMGILLDILDDEWMHDTLPDEDVPVPSEMAPRVEETEDPSTRREGGGGDLTGAGGHCDRHCWSGDDANNQLSLSAVGSAAASFLSSSSSDWIKRTNRWRETHGAISPWTASSETTTVATSHRSLPLPIMSCGSVRGRERELDQQELLPPWTRRAAY